MYKQLGTGASKVAQHLPRKPGSLKGKQRANSTGCPLTSTHAFYLHK